MKIRKTFILLAIVIVLSVVGGIVSCSTQNPPVDTTTGATKKA